MTSIKNLIWRNNTESSIRIYIRLMLVYENKYGLFLVNSFPNLSQLVRQKQKRVKNFCFEKFFQINHPPRCWHMQRQVFQKDVWLHWRKLALPRNCQVHRRFLMIKHLQYCEAENLFSMILGIQSSSYLWWKNISSMSLNQPE